MDEEMEYTYKKYECYWCCTLVGAPCTNIPCYAVLIPEPTIEAFAPLVEKHKREKKS